MEKDVRITKFNQEKKKAEFKFIVSGILSFIAIGLFLSSPESEIVLIFVVIAAIGFLVFLIMGSVEYSKIKKNFKNTVLKDLFQTLIPDIQYLPEKGISPTEAYASEFLKTADRFHSEDYISGTIGDVNFVSSDLKLEERHVQHTKNGTRVYYVTYFLGRIFRFDFNKVFTGNLQVLEAGSPYSRRKFSKVKLESIDFNKKFRIFAEEDITAFYILTPDIMEAIFNLEKRNPGRLSMSFLGDHLYVAMNNNRDTFELHLFRKLDESVIEEFKQDLLVIKDFIVSLKLNNKLFKKD